MNTTIFLAYRNITGNKKKSIFIVLIISVVLMMSLVVTIIKENLLSYNVQTIKIEKGSWHYIIPIKQSSIIDSILALDSVSDAAVVRRTLALEDERDSYDCFLVDTGNWELLINSNIFGELPRNKGELLAPDWYINKYSIDELPHTMSICGLDLTITGAYITDANDVYNERVRLYFSSPELTELFNTSTYTTSPIDSIIIDGEDTRFCFVRLSTGADPGEAVTQIQRIAGVSSFQTSSNASKYFESGVIQNAALLEAENFISTTNYTGNFISNNLSQIITAILLLVLFISIFVAMNLIISGDVRLCGILQALGFPKEKIKNIYIVQSLLLSLLSVPLGGGLGVAGSYLLLESSLVKIYGNFVIPWADVIVCLAACTIFVVLATLYPAIKASQVTCIEAISGKQQNDGRELDGFSRLSLVNAGSKFSFVIRYAVRNIAVNQKRIYSLILVISLLLSVFIKLSSEIEKLWKEGNWRQSYTVDFVVGYDKNIRPETKFIDQEVLEDIYSIEGIENVYYQYSIYDSMGEQLDGMYNYYFMIDKDAVTEQAYKQLALSSPITRVGYSNSLFIQAGISGYGEKELELALNYLIEGNVTVEQMKTENIILLPKYILWLENMDIPYTDLQVGDQVTIVENKSESLLEIDVVNEYTFTIGGFLDALPLPQVNGVSNGFVAIMYYDKLEQLGTSYMGISEIYIDGSDDDKTAIALETLCNENLLGFTDNTIDFRQQERAEKKELLVFSFYSIFAVLGAVMFLSVFNILLSNIMLRTREFSLLHIIGTRKWQRNLSILVEMLSFTIPGVFLGILGGVFLILLGDLSGEILNVVQLIPFAHITVSSAIIVAATIVAALLGIAHINRNITVNLDLV